MCVRSPLRVLCMRDYARIEKNTRVQVELIPDMLPS